MGSVFVFDWLCMWRLLIFLRIRKSKEEMSGDFVLFVAKSELWRSVHVCVPVWVCVLCEQTYLPGNHYCTDLILFEELKLKSHKARWVNHFYFYFCLWQNYLICMKIALKAELFIFMAKKFWRWSYLNIQQHNVKVLAREGWTLYDVKHPVSLKRLY